MEGNMSANENRPVAIRVSGVKKMYRLGQIGGGTLQADLQSWWARVRGKEDPNTKIGEGERIKGQTFMALNGIDLTIYQGEAVGIIGSNGAGKSTLLKLLSKVTAPTEGEIDIYGRIASMLEVGTGFNGELTGRENVYMNGAILGMTKQEIDAKMEQIIEFSEVRDFIDTPVKRYSSGMFVKLAFSVAAHLDSEIMIMDEVLAVGDINFQQKCLKKMREAAKEEGRTVLYVSHNMNTIRQLCDRCIVLDKGKVIYEGNVEESISFYSNTRNFSTKNNYDLSKINRIEDITSKIFMQVLDVNRTEIEMFEPFEFSLEIFAQYEEKNCMIRFVIFDRSGVTVGTAYSELFELKNGKSKKTFSFDTSQLAPGSYVGDIILCSYDGKIQIRHDIVTQVFGFVINETKEFYNMKWNSNGWGKIIFNEIKVEENG